jgi:uncharacterized protein with ATP-grasp and redox domains
MALRSIRFAGGDAQTEREIMQYVMRQIGEAGDDSVPVDIAACLMDQIREKIGVDDPYEAVKEISTRDALKIYPRLRALVTESDDPFKTAVQLAAVGNAIDFGVADRFDMEAVLAEGLQLPLNAPVLEELRAAITAVPWLLVMADNAGESVFDRILVETIHERMRPIPVKYAVKSSGGLNDTMRKDALQAGLDQCTEIVETGDGTAGTILRRCSADFRSVFTEAPLILSKGVGNYEGLSDNTVNTKIYYLFKVKCESMLRETGIPIGTLVLWHPSLR